MIEQITFKLNEAEYELYMQIENNYIIDAQERFNTVRMYHEIVNQLSSICKDKQYEEPQLMVSKFQDILKINDLLSITFLDTILIVVIVYCHMIMNGTINFMRNNHIY